MKSEKKALIKIINPVTWTYNFDDRYLLNKIKSFH